MKSLNQLIRTLRRSVLISILIGTAKLLPLVEAGLSLWNQA